MSIASGKDRGIEEDLVRPKAVLAHRPLEDLLGQAVELLDRVRAARTGGPLLADEQADEGEVVVLLQRQTSDPSCRL